VKNLASRKIFTPGIRTALKISLYLLVLTGCMLMISTIASAPNDVFNQTGWTGGADTVATAAHPADKTGWTKFYSKDTSIKSSMAGKISLNAEALSYMDTTDTDFGGTRDEIDLTGTGAGAYLTLQADIIDPFVSNVGKWTSLPAAPRFQNWHSAYVKAGNYIYVLIELNKFGRFDITAEEWDMMADTPGPFGPGASLAYPGTGDFIYATRGSGTKNFWKYTISTNTWSALADVPYHVSYGGSIASNGSNNIYCVAGGWTRKFCEYSISGDSWTLRDDVVNWQVGLGGSGNRLEKNGPQR